jgi:hypothetical protein
VCLGEGVASRGGQPVVTATRRSPGGGDCGHRAGDVRDDRRLWHGRHGRRVAAGNGHSKSSIVRFSRPTRGSSRNEPTFEGRAFVEAGARIATMTQHAQRPSVPHLASSCVARRLGGLLRCRPRHRNALRQVDHGKPMPIPPINFHSAFSRSARARMTPNEQRYMT